MSRWYSLGGSRSPWSLPGSSPAREAWEEAFRVARSGAPPWMVVEVASSSFVRSGGVGSGRALALRMAPLAVRLADAAAGVAP